MILFAILFMKYLSWLTKIIVPLKGVSIYVTREGDTIDAIINNLGIDANTLNTQNKRIFVMEDQLIVNKKEGN